MKWYELCITFGDSKDPIVETVMPCRLKGPKRSIKYLNISGTYVRINSSRGFNENIRDFTTEVSLKINKVNTKFYHFLRSWGKTSLNFHIWKKHPQKYIVILSNHLNIKWPLSMMFYYENTMYDFFRSWYYFGYSRNRLTLLSQRLISVLIGALFDPVMKQMIPEHILQFYLPTTHYLYPHTYFNSAKMPPFLDFPTKVF